MVADIANLGGLTTSKRIYQMFYNEAEWDRPWSHWICSEPMLDWLADQFGTLRIRGFPPTLLGLRVEVRNDPGGLRLVQGPRRRF
jgi:hypothetical protein